MRLARSAVTLAVALAFCPAGAAAETDCNAWARSDAAWPEIERILRDNYAYLGRVPDADAVLDAAEASAAEADGVAALGAVVEAIGYAMRDSHFHVRPVTLPERAWIPSSADMWVEHTEGVWRVADVRRDSIAFARGVRPGWEVLALGGSPLAELAREALLPVEPTPDEAQIAYAGNVVLSGRLGQVRRITFRHAGGTQTIDLPAGGEAIAPRPEALLSLTRIGRVAHLRFHNSLGNNDTIPAFDAALDHLGDADALIIDLRDTPGGGNTTVARAILGHFVATSVVYQVHRNAYEDAVFGVPRQFAEYVFPRGERWDRPVAVLAGRWTGSVGEALAMAFDRTAGVPTIGTPLADLLGTLDRNRTANGCLSLSFAWDALFAADGTPREDWIPRIPLEQAESAADGSDPAIEAAIAALGRAGR